MSMSDDSVRPRSHYMAPFHEAGGHNIPRDITYRVFLRHPGYSDTANILIILPALDHPQGGIHHETARVACAIIANNKWEGFLTETRTGEPASTDPDEILRGTSYYFRVSTDAADEKYPVISSFAHWRFPHDNLPTSWSGCKPPNLPPGRELPRYSGLTGDTLARDISCRITNHIEGTEAAHLVPRSEARWFQDNGMFRYTNQQRPGSAPINDAQNALLLRSDIRKIFDEKRFVIVPKTSVFLVHILGPGSSLQLTSLYHNVFLQPLCGVAIQYILARFAWSIFALSVNFLQQGLPRRLCIYAGEGEMNIVDLSGDQCRQLLASRIKTRTRSPQKRNRNEYLAPVMDGEEENVEDEYSRSRSKRSSFHHPSSQNSFFDEKTWSPSPKTEQDTDIDDDDDELNRGGNEDTEKRSSKRQRVAIDLSWKPILGPSSR